MTLTVLDEEGVREHLERRRLLREGATVHPLPGGVSGSVYLVDSDGERLVVKQPLADLRVDAAWSAKPERALTEAAALSVVHAITPRNVPEFIDLDEDAFILVMTAAPADWLNWKDLLLQPETASEQHAETASALGGVLASWHSATWSDEAIARRFNDDEAFAQLRLDPFHRAVLDRHPSLQSVRQCIDDLESTRECLVHGDFTPKNVLIGADGLWVLDFEVARFGAAIFDVASLLAHLMLKAIRRSSSAEGLRITADAFLDRYRAEMVQAPQLDRLGWQVAAIMLARVDGKSPVTYLDEAQRQRTRRIAVGLLEQPEPEIDLAWSAVLGSGS